MISYKNYHYDNLDGVIVIILFATILNFHIITSYNHVSLPIPSEVAFFSKHYKIQLASTLHRHDHKNVSLSNCATSSFFFFFFFFFFLLQLP